jgi:hypothetical protein
MGGGGEETVIAMAVCTSCTLAEEEDDRLGFGRPTWAGPVGSFVLFFGFFFLFSDLKLLQTYFGLNRGQTSLENLKYFF